MRFTSVLAACGLLFAVPASAQRGPVPSNAPLALVHANVVNVRDGRITPDATILRAMRSGIGKDGRRMHWQAMSWDIISNWSENTNARSTHVSRRLHRGDP